MKNVTTYVGMDAHKKDLFIAMLTGYETTPVTWQVVNEPQAVRRLVRTLEREAAGPVRVFYEAGPCGYALQRQMTTTRVSCEVVAPALIPRKPGERVKTNRRDARKLVELGRAGLLTAVRPPTPEEEAVRDLARARDDAREDRQRCRHRLSTLLLRRGLHYGGRHWTPAHRRWVASLAWAHDAERVVVEDYELALDQLDARLLELDARLAQIAQTDPYRAPVAWLRCFRGIDTLTAILILAELRDVRRFPTARALMALSRAGARRALQRGETSPRAHHAHRERAGAAPAGGNGVALPPSPEHRRGPGATAEGPTRARDCDGRQGAAPAVSTIPEAGRGT